MKRRLLFVLFAALSLHSCASEPAANLDPAVVRVVRDSLHNHPEFRELDSDFIVAKIDDLQLGVQKKIWHKDPLGEWELNLPPSTPVIGLLEVGGDWSAKLRLDERLQREVVEVKKVSGLEGQPRSVDFVWRYKTTPKWLKAGTQKGRASLVKNQFGGWEVSTVETVLSGSKGHVLQVGALTK